MKPDYLAVTGLEEKQQILPESPVPPRAVRMPPRNESGELPEEEDDMACCMMLMRKRVHYFPVFTWVFIMSSFFICYGIAVAHGHVEPDFPYISYTAIKSPERCYFAQLVNIGACLLGGNVYLRYLQMGVVLGWRGQPDRRQRRLNLATLVVGFLSALGFSMVANFQTQVMRPLHYTGAGLAFLFGLCYCWMSSTLTWKQRRVMGNPCVAVFQYLNSIVLTIFLIMFGITKAIYKYRESHGMGTKWDKLRLVYLLSTSTEWLTATFIVTFVLTLYSDFKKIRFHGPRVRYLEPYGPTPIRTVNGSSRNDWSELPLNHVHNDPSAA